VVISLTTVELVGGGVSASILSTSRLCLPFFAIACSAFLSLLRAEAELHTGHLVRWSHWTFTSTHLSQ